MGHQLNNLKDLYILELKDLYNANKQANATTEKLHGAATNSELKDALERSIKGTNKGNEHIRAIVESHDEKPTGHKCKGMEGLTTEAEEHVLKGEFGDDDVRDAMLISQYQRMAHYAITGYGTVEAFAKRLGLEDDAKKLGKCKEETIEGDLKFSQMAEGKNGINADAMA